MGFTEVVRTLGLMSSCVLPLPTLENADFILSQASSLYVDIGFTPANAKTKNKTIKENTVNFILGRRQLFLETTRHIQMKNANSARKTKAPANGLARNRCPKRAIPDHTRSPISERMERFRAVLYS